MNLQKLALRRFERIAPRLSTPMTPDLSDEIESWLRHSVCPAANRLFENPAAREAATWSSQSLTGRGDAEARAAVEAVELAIVEVAHQITRSAGADALPLVLKERPRLVLTLDFFNPTMTAPNVGGTLPKMLGDSVATAMFRRINIFQAEINRSVDRIQRRPDWETANPSLSFELDTAILKFEETVEKLSRIYSSSDRRRIRQACSTFAQVLAGYGALKDTSWLPFHVNSSDRETIRSMVRPVQMHATDGFEDIRVCHPDVIEGIAISLAEVESLIRRPIDVGEAEESIVQRYKLVLVDTGVPKVYWNGVEITVDCKGKKVDWSKSYVAWDLLRTVTVCRKKGTIMNADELVGNKRDKKNRNSSHAATSKAGDWARPSQARRYHLKKLLPKTLNELITSVFGKGSYILNLEPSEIAVLRYDSDDGTVEWENELLAT